MRPNYGHLRVDGRGWRFSRSPGEGVSVVAREVLQARLAGACAAVLVVLVEHRFLGLVWRTARKWCRQARPVHLPDLDGDDDARAEVRAAPLAGCGRDVNEGGLSWSTDRKVAERFPFLMRYRVTWSGTLIDPVLITAEVERDHIIALRLQRDEREIITRQARIVSIESLTRDEIAEVDARRQQA